MFAHYLPNICFIQMEYGVNFYHKPLYFKWQVCLF